MFSKKLCSTNFLSVRSALFADNASTSQFQHLVQNALGTARQFLRRILQEKSEIHSKIIRVQHRLPAEFVKGNGGPTVLQKSNFISYRPGFIQKVTSKWCTRSLTNLHRREILKRFYLGGSGPLIGFVGFALAKKPSLLSEEEELEGVSYLIRESFNSAPWKGHGLNIIQSSCLSSITLDNLKFENLIAKGCNAAIYSAHLKLEDGFTEEEQMVSTDVENVQLDINKDLADSNFLRIPENNSDMNASDYDKNSANVNQKSNFTDILEKEDNFFYSRFFIPHTNEDHSYNTEEKTHVNILTESFSPNNVAVKVMFNYNAESNASAIFNAMYKETLPCIGEFSFGNIWKHKVKKKKLNPHPNIVEIYTAFADQLPLLPDAVKNYPQALPSRLLMDGCGRNMTLFLVMKRYHCCLKEYLQLNSVTSEVSLLLFTQLLEALVYLLKSGVAHRDLKSDNILLDLSEGIHSPRLAISDFGCCSENILLPYISHDTPLGGNMLLMAPEVINSDPGPYSVIDYSRSDLWAAGTVAYEIFGSDNPFYCKLKSFCYQEKDLPPFPVKAPAVIQNLVMQILHVNPKQRPSPSFAATVCQVLLHSPSNLLTGPFNNNTQKKVLEWMCNYSSQTYVEVSLQHSKTLALKLELSRTFCSRLKYLELLKAVEYILNI